MKIIDSETKLRDLCDFSFNIFYSRNIVFSDENNLINKYRVLDDSSLCKIDEKPKGIWYSAGPAWLDYLLITQEEAWAKKRLEGICCVVELFLSKSVLKIITKKDFNAFEKVYANKAKTKINWGKVVNKYSGIHILYEEYESDWHDSWSCSSGCIWEKEGIIDTKILKSWKPLWLEE